MPRQLLIFVHLLGVIVWVGGMAFAYFCLRPATAATLAPPQRLPLWAAVFERFLPIVGGAVALLLGTGLAMLLQTGLQTAPPGWHAMLVLGLVMAAVYAWIHARLLPRLRRHCAAQAWPAAAQALDAIRRLVALNLALGLCTVAAAMTAR